MTFNLESFDHLPLQGVRYQLKPQILRAHQRYHAKRKGIQGLPYRKFYFYIFIALIIGCAMLHDAYPDWFAMPFFTGFFASIGVVFMSSLIVNSRERQRLFKDSTTFEGMLIGIDSDILWLGLEKKIIRFFLSPAAFKSIKFSGDYIYAYILTGGTIMVEQSVLLQSEQGKAVHAWLARAKAEIDFGSR